jgi:hypothetical protein
MGRAARKRWRVLITSQETLDYATWSVVSPDGDLSLHRPRPGTHSAARAEDRGCLDQAGRAQGLAQLQLGTAVEQRAVDGVVIDDE